MGACGTSYDDTYSSSVPGGTVIDLGTPYAHHTMLVFAYGTFSSLEVRFEISHDNENWFAIPSTIVTGTGQVHVDRVSRYVRGNVISYDGSELELLVTIASA
jgi:hypothetical protein